MTDTTLAPKAACRAWLLKLREVGVDASISRDEFAEGAQLIVHLKANTAVSADCKTWNDAANLLAGVVAGLEITG